MRSAFINLVRSVTSIALLCWLAIAVQGCRNAEKAQGRNGSKACSNDLRLLLSGYDCGFELLAFCMDDEGSYIHFRLQKSKFYPGPDNGKTVARLVCGDQWIQAEITFGTHRGHPSKGVRLSTQFFEMKPGTWVGTLGVDGPEAPDLADPEIRAYLSTDGESWAYLSQRKVYSEWLEREVGTGVKMYRMSGARGPYQDLAYGEERIITYKKRAATNDVGAVRVERVDSL